MLDAEDLGGGGGGGGGGERGGRLIVRKSDGSDCLRWKFTAPSNSADECSAIRVPRRSDGSLCCSIVLAAEPEPEPEAEARAGAAEEEEEEEEEPAEEYYDDSEFVTTRGSNKYREAAPIDEPSDIAGSSIRPNSSPSPSRSPVSAPAEDPADEEYDDSEFANTMGSGSGSSKQPAAAPIAPIAAADGALDPHPYPQPAVEEEEPLLFPAYEDDYNNDFVSPEPSPTKMSAVGFTKGAAAGSFLPSIPSCPTFLTPPTHPSLHRTAPH